MLISCQENLVQGENFSDKLKKIQQLGFKGVELVSLGEDGYDKLMTRGEEIASALEDSPVKVSSVCGGFEMRFLDRDVDIRKKAFTECKGILKLCRRLKCPGVILVPIMGKLQLPDLWPLKDAVTIEKEMLVKLVKELAQEAADNGTNILLEPLNRYQTSLINRLEDAVEICEMAGNPAGLKIMADFFHMNIEEGDIARSIYKAGEYISHVHLADSNRMQPGKGHIDFKSAFRALKEIGFAGYMALECELAGEQKDALQECRNLISQLIENV